MAIANEYEDHKHTVSEGMLAKTIAKAMGWRMKANPDGEPSWYSGTVKVMTGDFEPHRDANHWEIFNTWLHLEGLGDQLDREFKVMQCLLEMQNALLHPEMKFWHLNLPLPTRCRAGLVIVERARVEKEEPAATVVWFTSGQWTHYMSRTLSNTSKMKQHETGRKAKKRKTMISLTKVKINGTDPMRVNIDHIVCYHRADKITKMVVHTALVYDVKETVKEIDARIADARKARHPDGQRSD